MSEAGRPTKFNKKLAQEICETIACSSLSLSKLCHINEHWPARATIYLWRARNEKFREAYLDAKRFQVELLVDEILDIADDVSRDCLTRTTASGEPYDVPNHEWINRSRLRIDTRKWIASKLVPRLYGEKALSDKDDNDKDRESIEATERQILDDLLKGPSQDTTGSDPIEGTEKSSD